MEWRFTVETVLFRWFLHKETVQIFADSEKRWFIESLQWQMGDLWMPTREPNKSGATRIWKLFNEKSILGRKINRFLHEKLWNGPATVVSLSCRHPVAASVLLKRRLLVPWATTVMRPVQGHKGEQAMKPLGVLMRSLQCRQGVMERNVGLYLGRSNLTTAHDLIFRRTEHA